MPKGCAFCSRCDNALKICLEEVPEEELVSPGHYASCWLNVKKRMEGSGEAAS
jgi:oligopeptide transport system ATP-binding protein